MARSPAALLVPGAVLALVIAGCGGGAATTTGGCTPAKVPPARSAGGAAPPRAALDLARPQTLQFVTNCGSFTVTLDVRGAPRTSASLVSLARSGYYDNTIFHRIVPGFVIQGGDPTQTGSGGPGYVTRDVPPRGTAYTRGVVAMAKTALEPAGTAGSQFFVVTGARISLPPEYAVVGRVTAGLDVVEKIGKLGNSLEQPTEPVVVSKVVVAGGS